MTDAQEKSLIEALRKVDAHGDVAPMTMVLRQRAIQADLMRWDDSRGHYVLTGTGRSRISARRRRPELPLPLAEGEANAYFLPFVEAPASAVSWTAASARSAAAVASVWPTIMSTTP